MALLLAMLIAEDDDDEDDTGVSHLPASILNNMYCGNETQQL